MSSTILDPGPLPPELWVRELDDTVGDVDDAAWDEVFTAPPTWVLELEGTLGEQPAATPPETAPAQPVEPVVVEDLDACGVLQLAEQTLTRRRAGEVDDMLLCLQWADLHASDPRDDPQWRGRRRPPGSDQLVRVGGEGTPKVRELSIPELAVARETHTLSTRHALADYLDLRHRLPATYQVALALGCPLWLAAKTASMTRHLPAGVVHIVDAAVADAIAGHSPAKVLDLVAAKTIEADPDLHRRRTAEERARRFVSLTRSDEAGMCEVIARVEAGDAAWIDATLTRVTDILLTQWHRTHPDQQDAASEPVTPPTRDHLRSEALGWLARPAELLALLVEHADQPGPDERTHQSDPDETGPGPCRALAFPADLLDALRSRDLTALRPVAVINVHLHQAALEPAASGVARVEGLGPCDLARLADLIGDRNIVVQPVIDLADHISTAAYEFPEALKERIHLLHGGDAFPHATSRSRSPRRTDIDHIEEWQSNGPPGQTSTGNGQPLSRAVHRAKTHLGWRAIPIRPGTVLWHSPHGLTRLVDHHGTHHTD